MARTHYRCCQKYPTSSEATTKDIWKPFVKISNLNEGKFKLGHVFHGNLPYWDPMAELGDDEYDKDSTNDVVQHVQAVMVWTQAVARAVAVAEDIPKEFSAWQLSMKSALRIRVKLTTGKKQQLLEMLPECVRTNVPFLDHEHEGSTGQWYVISPSSKTWMIAKEPIAMRFDKLYLDPKHGHFWFHFDQKLCYRSISCESVGTQGQLHRWAFAKKNSKDKLF